jgi:phosphatidylglycerophosphate synthase
MSKLSAEEKFLDVSDYGRPIAVFFAHLLKKTSVTAVHATLLFGVCGLIAVFCIYQGHYKIAGIFLILKSIIDALDGELSRVKKMPSYVGRYLDSVFDILLNFLFLWSIAAVSQVNATLMLIAFVGLQLQGTLYNYYYVILRNNSEGGDKTSQIFEAEKPIAFPQESQKAVDILFYLYRLFYYIFDNIIYKLDFEAYKVKRFPNWFMTMISFYGLGFQLLLMAILLAFGWVNYIILFFIVYSVFIVIFIGIRKLKFKD